VSHNLFRKSKTFYAAVGLNVIEGLIAGSGFIVLNGVIKLLFNDEGDMSSLRYLTVLVGAIFVLRLLFYGCGYTLGQISGADVSRNIRVGIGDKLKQIPLSRFSKRNTGFYINAVTNEVGRYEKILTHKIGDIIKYVCLIMMACIFISTIHFFSALIFFVVALLLIPAVWYSAKKVTKYGTAKNKILNENVSAITEYVNGIQTLRSYGLGGVKNKTLTNSMQAYSDISYQYEAAIIPVGSFYSIVNWLAMPTVVLLAGNAWANGALASSELVLLCMLPLFLCRVNSTLFVELTAFKDLMISRQHLQKIVAEEEQLGATDGFSPVDTSVIFDRVSFHYNQEEPVLQKVSFTARAGKCTAIVGDSGSGKSTILNLLANYYKPVSGTILIGGCSTLGVAPELIFNQIALVDQQIFLFDDTIMNNVRYAKPAATDAEVMSACQLAGCAFFIEQLDQGYQSPVGENGTRLSGGERQRLSIARAILKDSPIVLLDEATASLDIENELAVRQAILNLLSRGKTVVMIAHTLSVISQADQILVVDNGQIVSSGTHQRLIEAGGKYAAMWAAETQL